MTTTTDEGRDRPARVGAGRRLVARTVRLTGAPGAGVRPADVDLLAAAGPSGLVWHDEVHGFAGRGTALRIGLPAGLGDADGVAAVSAALSGIEVDDEVGGPGCGPVAIGALPFARDASASLVVPEVLIGRRGDDAWITTVGPAAAGAAATRAGVEALAGEMLAAARSPRRAAGEAPDEFRLVSTIPQSTWRGMVAAAVARIRSGDLEKVVLARRISVQANRPIVTSDVLARLLALYPACMVFRVDGFLGASPELLIERRGRHVRSHPLAGTIARSGDLAVDAALVAGLMASAKDRSEHRFVIDGLRRALAPVCSTLDVPDEPSILELRNVSHLATFVDGELSTGTNPPPSALDLVARVHPTPAVGGTPSAEASAYIRRHEGFDRGRYAGPVGWMDAHGDGTWAIGIRSADVDGYRAWMYAGVGVVADSDPGAELAETQLKLQALLAALVRP